jgi:queuine tRNA-ribosyltransferase
MFGVLDYAPDMLPRDRPRYLMGVGKPDDIVGAVARDRHDGLRPALALGADGAGLHPARRGEHQERAPCRRSKAAGRGLHLSRLPGLFPRLPAPRLPLGRDHRVDAADLAQPALLPGAYGGHARGHRGGPVRAFEAAFHAARAEGDIEPI